MSRPKIIALTTCVNYSDFLSHFLTFNKHSFDRLLVVTTPDDYDTHRVCSYHHVEYYATDGFYANGQAFGKSQAINEGLRYLNPDNDTWIVHLDSDIVFPPRTMEKIREHALDKTCIYGVDRANIHGAAAWVNLLSQAPLVYEQEVFIRTDLHEISPRIFKQGGYVPIGYFQMWHSSTGILDYPLLHENAARSDMLHALRWDSAHRKIIPEVLVYHLESEAGPVPQGTNWNGRKTPPFKIAAPAPTPAPVKDTQGYPGPYPAYIEAVIKALTFILGLFTFLVNTLHIPITTLITLLAHLLTILAAYNEKHGKHTRRLTTWPYTAN